MMQDLLNAVWALAARVSPNKIEAIAQQIGGAKTVQEAAGTYAVLNTPAARDTLATMLNAWSDSKVSGDTLAGMLKGASHAHQRMHEEQSVQLVWTGPTSQFVPTRRTEQVLLEVILAATNELFVVTYVAYAISPVITALNEAIRRGVKVRILLESVLGDGGSVSTDSVATMRSQVPEASLYVWEKKSEEFTNGRVHAKLAVADDQIAFVTSANLTGYALERNMEAGVLIHGGAIPRALRSHLRALIETDIIQPS